MTDKQIIIDGVDVSYCPNHYNGWSALHRDHRPMCECGYDRECKPKDFECSHYLKCLEKQLKRKEQELQEAMDNYVKLDNQRVKEYNELVDKYNNKEQECEELKEENRNYSSLIWYIYCGSEDNLAEDVIGEYYNAKNECDNKYLDIFWKKIGNLEQTEYRLKKHSYKQLLGQLDQLKAENEELKKKVYKYEQAEKYPAAFLWQEGLL